jgi:hypothetical protein
LQAVLPASAIAGRAQTDRCEEASLFEHMQMLGKPLTYDTSTSGQFDAHRRRRALKAASIC